MNDTEKMIYLIRDHEVLYNTQRPEYRDLAERNAAWKQISIEVNLPVDDIKDAWCRLRNSYTNALKRREKCRKKNKTMPPWRYDEAMHFLRPFVQISKDDESNVEELEPQYFDKEDNQGEGTSGYNIKRKSIQPKRKNSENSNVSIEDDFLVGCKTETVYFDEEVEEGIPEDTFLDIPNRKKSRLDDSLSKLILDRVEDVSRRLPKNNKDDEFDSFAKYIASTLRTLSPSNAIKAKLELQTALSRIQLIDVEEKA